MGKADSGVAEPGKLIPREFLTLLRKHPESRVVFLLPLALKKKEHWAAESAKQQRGGFGHLLIQLVINSETTEQPGMGKLGARSQPGQKESWFPTRVRN